MYPRCICSVRRAQWNSGALVALGWASVETVVARDGGIGEPGGEELLAVQADGYVLAYDLLGHYRDRRFSMGQEALTQRVVDAKFFRAVIGASLPLFSSRPAPPASLPSNP